MGSFPRGRILGKKREQAPGDAVVGKFTYPLRWRLVCSGIKGSSVSGTQIFELSGESVVACVVIQQAEAGELEGLVRVLQSVSGKESLFTFHTPMLAHACASG
jgi:hypothetical protein